MLKNLIANIYKGLITFAQVTAFVIFAVLFGLTSYFTGQYFNLSPETVDIVTTLFIMFGLITFGIISTYRQSKKNKLGRNPTFIETIDDIKSISGRLVVLLKTALSISLKLGKWILIGGLVIAIMALLFAGLAALTPVVIIIILLVLILLK